MDVTRESIVAHIREHLARVWSHPNQREREDLMLDTNDKLAKAITMLLDRQGQDEQKLSTLQAENDQLKAAVAEAGDAAAWDQKAKDLLSKIEAIVGPVSDDDGTGGTTGSQPVVGSTSTTVTGTDGSTTTLDHASGSASTTDASGAPAPTDQAAADAAKAAAVAAGVAAAGA